jgi:hypothetical protein
MAHIYNSLTRSSRLRRCWACQRGQTANWPTGCQSPVDGQPSPLLSCQSSWGRQHFPSLSRRSPEGSPLSLSLSLSHSFVLHRLKKGFVLNEDDAPFSAIPRVLEPPSRPSSPSPAMSSLAADPHASCTTYRHACWLTSIHGR